MAKKYLIEEGMQFGVWTVISNDFIRNANKRRMYKVRCECGREFYKLEVVIRADTPARNSCKCDGPKYKQVKVGDTYGSMRVLEVDITRHVKESSGYIHKRNYVRMECECGTIKEVLINNLHDNITCGCTRPTTRKPDARNRHPLYRLWIGMIRRCECLSDPNWKDYGKRGISVSPEFKDFDVFKSIMGPSYKPGLTIDRIDNDGNYTPDNTRWATSTEQSANKRNSIIVEDVFTNDVLVLNHLAKRYNISPATIRGRYDSGKRGVELLNTNKSYYNFQWSFLDDTERDHIRNTIRNNPVPDAATLLNMSILDVYIIRHYEVQV